jgi:hypothetical protein
MLESSGVSGGVGAMVCGGSTWGPGLEEQAATRPMAAIRAAGDISALLAVMMSTSSSSGLGPGLGRAAVAIFEAYDVLEFGRRNLQNVAALGARCHAMPGVGSNVVGVTGLHLSAYHDALLFHLEFIGSIEQVQSLVLDLVVLQGERLSGIDVEDLADVPLGVSEDQLIAPGLFNALDVSLHSGSQEIR